MSDASELAEDARPFKPRAWMAKVARESGHCGTTPPAGQLGPGLLPPQVQPWDPSGAARPWAIGAPIQPMITEADAWAVANQSLPFPTTTP